MVPLDFDNLLNPLTVTTPDDSLKVEAFREAIYRQDLTPAQLSALSERLSALSERVSLLPSSSVLQGAKEIIQGRRLYLRAVATGSESAAEIVRQYLAQFPHYQCPIGERRLPCFGEWGSSSEIVINNVVEDISTSISKSDPDSLLKILHWILEEWFEKKVIVAGSDEAFYRNGSEPRHTFPVLIAFLESDDFCVMLRSVLVSLASESNSQNGNLDEAAALLEKTQARFDSVCSRLQRGLVLVEFWHKGFAPLQEDNVIIQKSYERYIGCLRQELQELNVGDGIILPMSTHYHAVAIEIERAPDINSTKRFTVRVGNSGSGAVSERLNLMLWVWLGYQELDCSLVSQIIQYDCVSSTAMNEDETCRLIGHVGEYQNIEELLNKFQERLGVLPVSISRGEAQRTGSCTFTSFWHLLERHGKHLLSDKQMIMRISFLKWMRDKLDKIKSQHDRVSRYLNIVEEIINQILKSD